MNLHHIQSLVDQVSYVSLMALAVVNLISYVCVAVLEQIKNREDLSVVGY